MKFETTMTKAEKIFVHRMIPHILAGKSFESAAHAVLADDERLWLATMARDDLGDAIRSELTAQIYAQIVR
jgi:hypothetical protein